MLFNKRSLFNRTSHLELSLHAARPYNKLIRRLVLSRLIPFGGHSPGRARMTTTRGATLSTTHWIIDRDSSLHHGCGDVAPSNAFVPPCPIEYWHGQYSQLDLLSHGNPYALPVPLPKVGGLRASCPLWPSAELPRLRADQLPTEPNLGFNIVNCGSQWNIAKLERITRPNIG